MWPREVSNLCIFPLARNMTTKEGLRDKLLHGDILMWSQSFHCWNSWSKRWKCGINWRHLSYNWSQDRPVGSALTPCHESSTSLNRKGCARSPIKGASETDTLQINYNFKNPFFFLKTVTLSMLKKEKEKEKKVPRLYYPDGRRKPFTPWWPSQSQAAAVPAVKSLYALDSASFKGLSCYHSSSQFPSFFL